MKEVGSGGEFDLHEFQKRGHYSLVHQGYHETRRWGDDWLNVFERPGGGGWFGILTYEGSGDSEVEPEPRVVEVEYVMIPSWRVK